MHGPTNIPLGACASGKTKARMDSITLQSQMSGESRSHSYSFKKRTRLEGEIFTRERHTPSYEGSTTSATRHQPFFAPDPELNKATSRTATRKIGKRKRPASKGMCSCGMQLRSFWINIEEKVIMCPDPECTLDFQNGDARSDSSDTELRQKKARRAVRRPADVASPAPRKRQLQSAPATRTVRADTIATGRRTPDGQNASLPGDMFSRRSSLCEKGGSRVSKKSQKTVRTSVEKRSVYCASASCSSSNSSSSGSSQNHGIDTPTTVRPAPSGCQKGCPETRRKDSDATSIEAKELLPVQSLSSLPGENSSPAMTTAERDDSINEEAEPPPIKSLTAMEVSEMCAIFGL